MKNFLAIKLDNVSKGFEGKTVIDQITCEFKNKEVHVILGKSGTGKSVLLKMIMGLFKPELGRILIDNKDLNIAVNENDLILSYIFQSSALLNSLNVLDNITIFLDENRIGSKDERVNKAYDILSDLGIQDSAKSFPSELSGGMRKRVAIARSLIISPDILLYDEPTAELDPINTKVIAQIIKKLKNDSSITQIVVTHDINFAYSIADKISILENGKIIISGSVDTIKESNNAILEPI
ncbi:MAG: ABC transporter ATP-binding protein [Thermodesulfobacteriota bacterium]|nr:ATP-binding cassette domain-containing protein [Deltaproteobacteria bacterium TMED58]RZP16256.1 MAG: ATP-binding cassette domain-containing protein [Candidatus Dadabacteria bacterium]|tara:strand:+ start:14896 stop:15609 length:714 start_codon:yes stop_codon:yes gene_type:complete